MTGEVLQIVSAGMSTGAFLLVIRLSFQAGRMVEKVEDHDKRMERLERIHLTEGAD